MMPTEQAIDAAVTLTDEERHRRRMAGWSLIGLSKVATVVLLLVVFYLISPPPSIWQMGLMGALLLADVALFTTGLVGLKRSAE